MTDEKGDASNEKSMMKLSHMKALQSYLSKHGKQSILIATLALLDPINCEEITEIYMNVTSSLAFINLLTVHHLLKYHFKTSINDNILRS